jgi:hypothetical protein
MTYCVCTWNGNELNHLYLFCFAFLSFSLENHFSRVGTGHVNLPSGHGAEESVGGATSPQALDQRGGRLTSPLKTRWTRVDGWVTTFFCSKRIHLRIMCFCLCCCWTFKANPDPKIPWKWNKTFDLLMNHSREREAGSKTLRRAAQRSRFPSERIRKRLVCLAKWLGTRRRSPPSTG